MNDMAPDASPAGDKKRVRRVNNLPMIIIAVLVCMFLLVMMFVAVKRAQKNVVDDKKNAKSSSMFARAIVGDQSGGIIKPSKPPELADMPTSTQQAANDSLQKSQNPLRKQELQQQVGRDQEAEKIRIGKLQRLEQAAQAKTTVQITPTRGSGQGSAKGSSELLAELRGKIDAEKKIDPMASYKEKLAEIASLTGNAGKGGEASSVKISNSYSLFANGNASDRWKLGSRVEPPRSPYELRAGFILPATLISGINSELPGQIMGQVSQSVYDTPTGKYLLIPQGSRLVGSYSSEVAYGQSRVLIGWQRIVFPDGKALDIGSMPGADSAGYSGFYDQVNNHYLRIFGSAVMMSGVVAGISLSQDSNSTSTTMNQQRAGDVMSAALGQQLGQVTAEMIRKNMNISPTLEIRPGYRFNVIVTKDLTFEIPYQPFDYSTKEEEQ
ncbi:MAG: TrbI/VirB10 family protein [Pseudomonadota bacterium]